MKGCGKMILKKAKICNFKQFYGTHELIFNTNGKVTVVYGFNGFGKTRLHSFFYWLFYGTDRLKENIYNIPQAKRIFSNDALNVSGELEFEHNKEHYLIYREETFKKYQSGNLSQTEYDFGIRKKDKNGNLKLMNNFEEIIEDLLPKELAHYFFFDGEGMANELRGEKAKTNHRNLKNAVNRLFGLKLYDSALKNIGSEDRKNNAISELTKQLKDIKGANIEAYQRAIQDKTTENEKYTEQIEELNGFVKQLSEENQKISEQIGQYKNTETLDNERKSLEKDISKLKKEREKTIERIGHLYTKSISHYIVSNKIQDVKNIIQEKVDENYVSGLDKKILDNILAKDACICGNSLQEKEISNLKKLLDMVPPKSYKNILHDYIKKADYRLRNSSEAVNEFEKVIDTIAEIDNNIFEKNERINEIDSELENMKNVRSLSEKRRSNIDKINESTTRIEKFREKRTDNEKDIKSYKLAKDKKVREHSHNDLIKSKISFLKEVKDILAERYERRQKEYKNELEKNIRQMTKDMLSVNRTIVLQDDYTLEIKDSHGKPNLSAGQAAIMSFSYIGGVLKTLKNLDIEYVSDAYPLVLDAPLSHLDVYHIQKVFDHLPEFSNQIIIFSKEEVDEYLTENINEYTYQINSNEEGNIAEIKEYNNNNYFNDVNLRRIDNEFS